MACTTPCSKAAFSSTSFTKRNSHLRRLNKYSALVLPNTALLSEGQCRQLRAYVDGGGSLLATFETSMYTERNERRSDFGLADVFGIRKAGDMVGTTGNAYLARIERQHAILNGFKGTNWIPGRGKPRADRAGGWPGSYRGARVCGLPAGTVVPDAVTNERTGRRRARKGCEPAGLFSRGRGAYDVAVRAHRSRPAPSELDPLGCGRESARDDRRRRRDRDVRVGNRGRFRCPRPELHEPRHAPRLAEDVLSYRRAEGPDEIARPRRVARVELLRAESNIPFRVTAGAIEFTIPRVVDYEVAAIHSA